ncbi:nuclease-related domain-containing protein [Macrococcus carouselicus]|uniref:NERD domain-containing protein n=1 Tax=Macrococcus carouselicus TaxID=69969 RepID=A0A9Q8FQW5_9STAP|nr:nuclease-related domain-containing protein [Macrococcus carouselicus]TDM04133.1 NERD domain-containing protein [Macrococcus carouselicus]
MVYKIRRIPEIVEYQHALLHRHKIEPTNEAHGYDGEYEFYTLIKNFSQCIVLWDIDIKNRYKGDVQYDFIIIHELTVYHFDIKNYSGLYSYQNDNLISSYQRIVKNPDPQLHRADRYLKSLTHQFDPLYDVESYNVFINETFYLENSPSNSRWLTRPKLLNKLKLLRLPNSNRANNKKFAEYIVNLHSERYKPVEVIPIQKLITGLRCPNCRLLNQLENSSCQSYQCLSCSFIVKNADVICYNLKELYILTGRPFTVKDVAMLYPTLHRSSVQRVLQHKFIKIGDSRASSYRPNDNT